MPRPHHAWLWGLLLLAPAVLVSLSLGADTRPLWTLVDGAQAGDQVAWTILREVRLPRALASFLVGASLSLSGVLLQAATRNPVADPYLVGTSAGATTAAVLAGPLATWLLPWLGVPPEQALPWLQPLFAFAGALAAVFVAFAAARAGGPLRPERILLAGLVLTAFGGALTSFLLYQFSDLRLRTATLWLMGGVSLPDVRLAVPMGLLLASAWLWSLRVAPRLNALGLGADAARGLGVAEATLSRDAILWSSALAAIAVSLGGIIGFVGLLVPHAIRSWRGSDHRALVPAAVLAGGAFLLVCDALARTLVAPAELPVGILTALAGAPVLVILLGLHRRTPRNVHSAPAQIETPGQARLIAHQLRIQHDTNQAPVLDGVSLMLEAGQFITLVGANGAGKSSLLRVLAGVARAQAGHVADHGKVRAREDVSPPDVTFLPQDPRAESGVRVHQLVALGRTAFLEREPWRADLPAADSQAVQRALTALELESLASSPCDALSGGQLQRAFVAMALAREAGTLLLDEPTASLDLPQADRLLRTLSIEAHGHQRLVVAAVHDLRLALRHADAVLVAHAGDVHGPFLPTDPRLGTTLCAAFGPDILELAGLDRAVHP